MFCPETDRGPSSVAICEDCVLTCAKAVDVERRLSQRPTGAVDEPEGDDDPPPGKLVEWTPFELGGLELEWRADRSAIHSARPMYHVTLRKDGAVENARQLHQAEPTADSVRLALETEHLADNGSPAPDSADGGTSWQFLGGREGYEWACERVWVANAGMEVNVAVRRAGDPTSIVRESFSSRIHPTVDDAETVAEDHWEKLHR
jgi:hypothetical protein